MRRGDFFFFRLKKKKKKKKKKRGKEKGQRFRHILFNQTLTIIRKERIKEKE